MAPTPEMQIPIKESVDGCINKVVISGMSGLYPKSRYVKDLENILYNKINPVTSEDLRWKYKHPEVATYAGSVPELQYFDAQFFKVHYRLAFCMDAMARKMLETAYEAIYDAGVNPDDLSGKKVGVYVGTCFSETEKAIFYEAESKNGFGIAGCSKSMFSNRISYWLNSKGPSQSIDTACSSSTVALEQAYLAIARGECEAAVVGGGNLCLHPQSSVHYGRITTLSKDGKTRSFDENASGCCRSEAINVLFLQKASNALRVYADVVHVKAGFLSILDGEIGPRYGFNRNPSDVTEFLLKFYNEAGISPQAVEYVEAFGSADPEADKSELESIDAVFCKDRKEPLLVGSVMSNIGYGEAASGLSAVTKVLLGYHRGELAGNLSCDNPRTDLAALRGGRMQIVQENKPFRRTYTAVNNMSVTGVNAHVLLHGRYKPKDINRYKASIPQLVTVSGRQDSSVKRLLEHLKSNPIDPEELALLRNIHKSRTSGHLGRGYIILDEDAEKKTVSLSEKCDYFDDANRPLWFVYSGMGSQWAGMGAQLMRIPIFANAIEKCRIALEPKGIDIVHIITSPDKHMFDNILHSFVGIAAIQIGLTDILRELGIVPDNIIGHSVGELGCAYADGCLTAEEMILSAYSRGLVSLETEFIRGSMAAVGVGFSQISEMCPPEIEVACHNGPESATISGPADVMKQFVAELTAKGIFAKEVPCSNIAYHSRYIAKAGPGLLKYLKEVIKTPRERTARWVSTSVPQSKWNEPIAKYSSAEYHTNNLLSPVLFEETMCLIPSNAVLIEVAPHGLLQAILKRSLPESCTNIPLTRRLHPDNAQMLLDAVGKLYMEGYNPDVQVLYPKIDFPVSTGTPMLSHFVDWAHGEKWPLALYAAARRSVAASCKYIVSTHDEEHSIFRGRVIQGKIKIPFSFALVAAWDTLAMTVKVPVKQLNVEFSDVMLFTEPVLHEQRPVRLTVTLHRGNGRFEVMDGMYKVVAGFIKRNDDPEKTRKEYAGIESSETVTYQFKSEEIYQLLYERGHKFSDEFCVIKGTNETMCEAEILWKNNWVTFIDGLIQLSTVRLPHTSVSRLNFIRSLSIDVEKHNNYIEETNDENVLKAKICDIYDRTICGGVVIEHLDFDKVPALVEEEIELKSLTFVPRVQSDCDTFSLLQVYLQIVAENMNKNTLKVIGLKATEKESAVFMDMTNIAKENNVPGVKVEYQCMMKNHILIGKAGEDITKDVDLVLIEDLSNEDNMCESLYKILKPDSFIINVDHMEAVDSIRPSTLYSIVASDKNHIINKKISLARWRPTSSSAVASSAFTVRSESDLPLLASARKSLPPQNGFIIITSYPPVNGLKNLVKKWRKEETRNKIYLVMVKDGVQKIKGLDEMPNMYLAFNVLDNGVWGGEYYLPVKETVAVEGDLMLTSEHVGSLDSLKWIPVQRETKPGVPVKVHYTAVNLYDAKRATGVIPTEPENSGYGMDFSGITERGERVMGLLKNGSARTQVIAHPELLWPVPASWTLKEAATVPLAYSCIFYLMRKIVKLGSECQNNIILVHGGTGAMGQAMINVALGNGFKVFVTVSDIRKKKILLKLFPEIKEEHIGCSRDETFADMVLQHTDGEGAQIVLCSVRGNLKNISFKSCSKFGTTFDTVQIKQEDNFIFGMDHLTKDRSYASINITSIFSDAEMMKAIQTLLADGIARGFVRPLTSIEYSADEAPRAFRLLSFSKHCGRVLLRMTQLQSKINNCITCAPEHNHLIVSDGQPLALQLVDRLITRGAKNIHLNLTHQSPPLLSKMRIWKNQGIAVTITSLDLENETTATDLVKQIKSTGFIAGVFIIQDNVERGLVEIFDAVTRKTCPYMKYFLALTDSTLQKTFSERVKDGLPATCLDISQLKNSEYQDLVWYQNAVDAIEQALCTSQPVILPVSKHTPAMTLVQQISKVTNIYIHENTPECATLESVGVDLVKSHVVSKFLKDVHNIYIDHDEIPAITMERLKEIEESLKEIHIKQCNGLETFFSYLEPDELLATTESVMLPTLTNSAGLRDDEFDVNETYMCIIPGMDGLHSRFIGLCERLKLPVLVLQPGLDHLHEDVDMLADRYSQVLLRKTGINKSFLLMGYELGNIVALKIASILEENGLTGTVFCIGDGPEETVELIQEQLKHLTTDEELQIALIKHMYTLHGDADTEKLDEALAPCTTWEKRLDACLGILLGRVSHSAQYARNLIEAAYVRIKMSRDLKLTPVLLKSQIILIRAGSTSPSSSTSLAKYSMKPVIVHDVPTSLGQVTNDLRCTSIINKHLPTEVLEAFSKRNLCDTYLLNADTFMSNIAED